LLPVAIGEGPATWDEDILLVINRYGFNEETHWLIAYSPVPDESVPSGIGGVLATVHETTGKVLSERRMTALRDLGGRPAEAKTPEAACVAAAHTLEAHGEDIPFALLYLTDADGRQAHLAATAGVAAGQDLSPQLVDLGVNDGAWPLAEAKRTMQPQVVAELGARFSFVPSGPWPDPPNTAVVLPIGSSKPHEPAGFLVAGVSSRLRLDDAYLDFLGLVTAQTATTIANARAYEVEKRRAESLAELDRAKITFFSNVSHEFRTPLTLILGPLDDAINDATERWQRDRLLTLQRNAFRLQKLVNTLLDFSRIEARRVQVSFRPVDLSAFTRELASNFQSACEKAGLELVVDCAALPEPVYVDAVMWERIVLNLVSNAFKFTLKGRIEVTLRQLDTQAELVVRDTGVGIPADQMPRLFERFHRVEGVTGRTQEGSGIGLALVRELVRLHGAEISAESVAGEGTSFVVKVPFGTAHLQGKCIVPATALNSTALRAGHYVEEALRWLPDANPAEGEALTSVDTLPLEPGAGPQVNGERPRVLLADDNADMRQYLRRVLSEHYYVEAVPDGRAALDAVKRSMPDLILSDVMMPRLDGFGLLREIRADPQLCALPVILLSARAGEESRVEGMQAVADDYLVKPFGARELLARVSAHLQIARLRRRAENDARHNNELFRLVHQIGKIGHWEWNSLTDENKWSPEIQALYGLEPGTFEGTYEAWAKLVHPDDLPRAKEDVRKALETGKYFTEFRVIWPDGSVHWLEARANVFKDGHDKSDRIMGVNMDVTERKRHEEALREADRRKDEFLATLAHELRNPLAPIRNALQIIRLSPDRATREQARTLMERQLGQMVRLVDDLLDVSRVSTGKLELRRERVPLAAVVSSAVDTSRPMIDHLGHELTVTLPKQPIIVDADPTRLAQVFCNLLNNSAKYMDRCGRIWLTAERQGSDVVVSVKDTGIGIAADQLPRIFQMYTQVNRTLEKSQCGLGIGLTLAKRLVEMHGGSIDARSEGLDMGAEFIVRLPVVVEASRPQEAGGPDEPADQKSSLRILIVDDNRDGADSLGMMLRIMGNDTRTAYDGQQGVDEAGKFQPDVVMLDIGLPKLNGYEACRRIREQSWGKGIVLIALTGWGQEEDRRRSREAGFDHHMVKPVDPQDLIKLLARLQAVARS
jgi:PAS domain S-box-containing protein